MEFRDWLRQIRKEKNVDLRTLAESSKLNASTISRIERGIIDPALSTVVRITHALGARPEEFYNAVTGRSIEYQSKSEEADLSVLTLEDVIKFEKLVSEAPKAVEEIIAEKINQIQEALPEFFKSRILPSYYFRSDDIFLLLNGSILYSVWLHYPFAVEFSISASSIIDIFLKGGLIIRNDVSAYLSLKAGEKIGLPIKGSEEAKIHAIRKSSLFDKNEREPRLSEIIRADNILAENREILVMNLLALENERIAKLRFLAEKTILEPPGHWWNLQCLKFGYMLIILSRWIEALDVPDSEWLNEIRSQMDFEVKEE
jgi:transcriptional regulator with XRE-family HTH domain